MTQYGVGTMDERRSCWLFGRGRIRKKERNLLEGRHDTMLAL